jgi:hypothetical protein
LEFKTAKGTKSAPAAITTGQALGRLNFWGYNGSSFTPGSIIEVVTSENWTAGLLGTELVITKTNTGAGSLVECLRFDGVNNLLLDAATRPTSLAKGVVLADGTAASANPTSAIAFWSASGVWQYRTSAASEGAGQTNHLHNRAEQVTGSGTDYTLTNATARVDFGTTDPQVTLPTAGTYLITAEVAVTNGATATDNYQAKFYNSTDAGEVTSSAREVGAAAASQKLVIPLSAIVTVTASKTIQLYAHNTVAARGTVVSTQTAIRYVRLH